ncbi:MAG: TatD family hydrolase [Desulfurococcales archaeon]|nr:TatD family hydrolase [Desulfurococcales archaeon]
MSNGKLVPIADGHCHTNPVRGMGAEKVAERFRAQGGWFIALVALSPWAYSIEFTGLDSYKEMIEIHIRECMNASKAGLETACLAGFHPADVDKLIDKYRMKPIDVLELGKSVLEYVASLCDEGVLDGIGEVGRQHYKTFSYRAVISQYLMEYALELARDHGCVVHLHLEQEGETTLRLVDMPVTKIGLSSEAKRRIVFHHSKPSLALLASRYGYSSTVPGTPQLTTRVLGKIEPVFVLESDFIDDPARPGAVVYPWIMADTVQRLVAHRSVDEEYLYRINVDNVEKIYGVVYRG